MSSPRALAVGLIQPGAAAYILKDRPSRLPVAIESAFRRVDHVKSREKAEEEQRNMKDSLEMLNRRLEAIRKNERA